MRENVRLSTLLILALVGFRFPQKKARQAWAEKELRSKSYRATIEVVSKDTKAREFRIEIDLDKIESAIKLV
jgi:hypothetical protein